MHIQARTQSHYQHFLWRECCQTIFSSAGGKTTRGTKKELQSYSQKVCGFILFPSQKWIQNKKNVQAKTRMKKICDMVFFCVGHWHFVTFDRTKIHLSFGKNFLLVQFESSTDLPSDCGWLLSRIQGIFFRKLSCQLLQKTKRTLEVSQKELIKIAFIIQFGFISHTASLMQMLLSSSILCFSVSSSASCLALSAASMSFLAVWELSDSWEPASHGQNVTRVQKSSVYVCYDPVWVRVCVHARLGRIKCAHTCQPDRMFTGKWMEHFDKEFNIQWCVFVCFKKGAAEDKMPDAYPHRPDIAPVFFETLLKTSTPPSNLFMLSLHLLFKGIKLTLLSCIQYAVIILYDDDTSIKCTNHFN